MRRLPIALTLAVLGALAVAPAAGAKDPLWLCRPDLSLNPCRSSLDTTVETGTGAFMPGPLTTVG